MELINQIIFYISAKVEAFISATSYLGVVLLMAIESFNIPLPSEIILTFTGYLVAKGEMNFHLASLAGAVGCVVGSLPSYWIGYYGGRNFLCKHGKWLLITPHDLDSAEKWVAKYGDLTFFICRMLPVVRTFISLPAGVLKARFWPFTIYTFIGSWIWSYGLVWVGVKFGENKELFSHYWHQFDALIIAVCFILGCVYVYKHVQHFREGQKVCETLPVETPAAVGATQPE